MGGWGDGAEAAAGSSFFGFAYIEKLFRGIEFFRILRIYVEIHLFIGTWERMDGAGAVCR